MTEHEPYDGHLDGEWWSFDKLERDLREFERLLADKCGLAFPLGESLPKLESALREMIAIGRRQRPIDETLDHRDQWRGAVGLADLVRLTVAAGDHPQFPLLCKHFSLLESAMTITQNRRSRVTDAATNKIFELLIGLVAMPLAEDVELDDPNESKGNNPDVIATVGGVSYGFACKVPHTGNPKSYYDNVAKAVKQIEVADVDTGFVFMNLMNIIDHDELNPKSTDDEGRVIYYGFPSTSEAQKAVTQRVERFRKTLPDAFDGEAGFNALFEGKKARPIIVNYFATLLGIQASPSLGAANPEPVMTVSIFRVLTGFALSPDALRENDLRVLELINRRLH